MSGLDMMMENAMKLLVARIPQANIEKLANVAQIAIELDGKLSGLIAEVDALKTGQAELKTLLIALVQTLQQKGFSDGQLGQRSTEGHVNGV